MDLGETRLGREKAPREFQFDPLIPALSSALHESLHQPITIPKALSVKPQRITVCVVWIDAVWWSVERDIHAKITTICPKLMPF